MHPGVSKLLEREIPEEVAAASSRLLLTGWLFGVALSGMHSNLKVVFRALKFVVVEEF